MLANGTKVVIVKSNDMSGWGVAETAGMTGTIVNSNMDEAIKNKSYCIRLDIPYLHEYEWFFPISAVRAKK